MKPPKLPIPSLVQTLTSYLRALEPLVSPKQLRRTKAIADKFCAPHGVGNKLQNFLLKKYRETDSWSHEYLQNRVYLENRASIPYLQNIVGVIPQRKFPHLQSMALFVAAAIATVKQQKNLIRRGEWPTERWRGQPLCMQQHENMLRCYRVPQLYRDRQYIADDNSDHVILMHRNQAYCLRLKQPESVLEAESEIAEIARSVMAVLTSPAADRAPAVGLLTALDRDLWATTRDLLLTDSGNAKNLKLIENSMLIVCLDEVVSESDERINPIKDIRTCILQMFHGGGDQFNGGNRWFDKDVQMVVSKDGVAGYILEHSFMDGTIMKILATTWGLNWSEALQAIGEHIMDGDATGVVKLEWNLCPTVQQRITKSGQFVNWMVKNLDYKILDFNGYGADWLKSVKCSPDAFVQLALQLTAYQVHGEFINSYSPAHLRLFRCGRTEIIRPLTSEAVRWVKYFIEVDGAGEKLTENQQLLSLFAEAMERQAQMTVAAISGQGFDLHLMCLCEAAKEITGSVPELFQDESYAIANNFQIISSQVPRNQEDWFAAYGPDCEDGRGIYYSINPNSIDLSATSWLERNPSAGSEEFLQVLVDVLYKMQRMISPTVVKSLF